MRKRKALKGGYTFTDPTIAGPVLKEKLYQTTDDDIIALKSKYNKKYEEAEKDLNKLVQIKKEADINYYKALNQKNKDASVNDKQNEIANKQTIEVSKLTGSVIVAVGKSIWAIFTFAISNLKYAITTISTAGKGAIIKAILAILFIILVIAGAINGFSGLNSNSNNIKNSGDAGKDILKKDTDDYINMKRPNNIFSSIGDFFNNLLPNDYKNKLGSISNSLTYITTGKNQYDEYLEPRTEILEGRSDNIFHINLTKNQKYSKDNTYSIIKPKDILLEFNENLYYNSDYNKIDNNIKAYINNYPQKCIIPIKSNINGRYILDLDSSNIKYYTINDNIIENSNLIKPIFEYSISGSNLQKTAVKLRSFNNHLYTNYFDANNVLGAYATKLINPNYKGPIIRLTNANEKEIYTENENENGKRTADFFNDYNTSQLYTIIDNKKIDHSQFFNNQNSSVVVLYDQSVNNTHLKFSKELFKWPPAFVYNKNNNSYIWFNEQQMLMFTQPISYKNLKIYMKFKFTAGSFTKARESPMFFLSTKNNSIITIDPIEPNKIAFKYAGQKISKDYTSTTDITEQNIDLIINSDNPIILECLGNNVDNRTTLVRDFDIKNDKLQEESKKNSLNAYIYELRIFKLND